jgi:hypothetical protein
MTSKRLSEKSGLLDIAGRNRGRTEGDEIISIAATVLDIREHVADLYKEIAEQTLFKHDEEFVPVPIGFKNEELVAELQEKIGSLQSVAAALETVIGHIEERFKEAKVPIMGGVGLDNLIDEVQGRPDEIARAISRRAIELIQSNPTASLLSAWSDEALQLLEVSKVEAVRKSEGELKGLIALKDSLQGEIALGRRIASGYKYPGRVLNQDQVDKAFAAMPEPAALPSEV